MSHSHQVMRKKTVPKFLEEDFMNRVSEGVSRKTVLYVIRINLIGSAPAIWRRLRLPGYVNLGYLHSVIQIAMVWTNSHLHHFIVGSKIYADLSVPGNYEGMGPEYIDEYKTILAGIKLRDNEKILY